MDKKKPLSIVIGAGEGLGSSLVTQLAKHEYKVVGINRSKTTYTDNNIVSILLDSAREDEVNAAIGEVIHKHGMPEVLIHNTAQLDISSFEETSAQQFENAWRSMVYSAFIAMKIVVPMMVKQGHGTIIVSGATASLRAGANFSAFASAKFALRGLTQSVAREYQKQGVHVAHVILDGILDTPKSRELHAINPADMMSTDDVAEAYMQIIKQKPSAWTHELDLRPKNETF